MSTILKALRRLEQEKSAQVQRPLREQVATPSEEPRRRIPVLVSLAGVFGAGLLLGAAVLLLWPDAALRDAQVAGSPAASPPAPTRTERPSVPVASAPPAPRIAAPEAPRPTRSASDLPGDAYTSPVAVVKLPEVETTPDPETAAPPPHPPGPGEIRPGEIAMRPHRTPPPHLEPELTAEPAPAREPVVRAAPPPAREPVVRTEPAPAREPVVRTAPAPPPEPVRVAAAPAPKPRAAAPAAEPPRLEAAQPPSPPVPEITPRAPARPEPAPAAQPEAAAKPPAPTRAVETQPVPEIFVERTHWHPLPERRLAIVDVSGHDQPLELHEGDEVGPLRVARIEPSGVVFVENGQEVRHAVGH